MPIFMTHPDHGATHVGSGEVEEHEKNGWKLDTYENWMSPKRKEYDAPKVPADDSTEKPPIAPAEIQPIAIRKAPGRKPKAK